MVVTFGRIVEVQEMSQFAENSRLEANCETVGRRQGACGPARSVGLNK